MHNASRSKTFFFILNFIRIGDQDVNLTVKLIIKYMVSFVLTSPLIFSLQLFGSSVHPIKSQEAIFFLITYTPEQSLLVLLSKDYVYMIGISLVVSVPVTWYLMRNWLQSFEYRVPISWQVFAWAGAFSLGIALATISYQAIETAWTRPAETLKYE